MFDSVPRHVYDRKCAEYDTLFAAYEKLKLAGAVAPAEPRQGRVVPAGPTSEEMASKRMHDSMIEGLAKDIEGLPGVSPAVAKREAERLRALAVGGSIMEPPV
jgi:hypothetical protein